MAEVNKIGSSKLLGKIECQGMTLHLVEERYKSNDRLAIVATLPNGEVWGMISCNDPSQPVANDCFLLKCWSENYDIAQVVLRSNIFEDTGLRIKVGYVDGVPVLRVKEFVWYVTDVGPEDIAFKSKEAAEAFAMGLGGGANAEIKKLRLRS